ncbi:MAG: GntR family transcriptional regulator [Sphaerochaetaceae bacterium]
MKLKYQTVFLDLQGKILAGDWPQEAMIPTETELCNTYSVSRITIRRALDELVQLGFIHRIRGKGTFVLKTKRLAELRKGVPNTSAPKDAVLFNHIAEDVYYGPETEIGKNFVHLLNLQAEGVVRLRLVSYMNDHPYALMSIFLPLEVSNQIDRETLISKTFLETYEAITGQKIATIHRSISAVIPDDEQCDLLQTRPGSAHLWMKNVAYLDDESPVAMNYAIYNGNVYDFVVELELGSSPFF